MARHTHDFDEEARKIFASLNLSPERASLYNNLDPIWEHPETKARFYVGNQTAAASREILDQHNITAVVNATDNMPLYHDGEGIDYYRFHISGWMTATHGKHSAAVLNSFFAPTWSFIDDHLEQGHNVMVHCLAGAHRAGTTGVAYIMYKNRIPALEAIKAAKTCRPIINPIGLLRQLVKYYEAGLLK